MWIMVDVEADGPAPGIYSMVSFGAIVVEEKLDRSFYGQCKPISDIYKSGALKACGLTREETLEYPDPKETMLKFDSWLENLDDMDRPYFISDNNGFDWQFINYYFWSFLDRNPFGHSSSNLGSLYKGQVRDTYKNFKHLRKTKHTHHPVDDAKGNAEALLQMQIAGLKIRI